MTEFVKFPGSSPGLLEVAGDLSMMLLFSSSRDQAAATRFNAKARPRPRVEGAIGAKVLDL